jgi:ATP-dependent helicase/nuclease subunit A
MTALVDQNARDRIRSDLDSTLIVEAAAGTGKTSELVRRVLALLVSGKTTLPRLVAVTFTEKAAGEMKLRLRSEIERARASAASVERARLDRALEELEQAHIGTIHGFCADLLRQRPVEARVDPLFEVLAEDSAGGIFDEAFERWFQGALADPPESVHRVLRRRSGDRDNTPKNRLRSAGLALAEQRDFEKPWRRDPFDRHQAIDAVMDDLVRVATVADRIDDEDDWASRAIFALQRSVTEMQRSETAAGRDYDGLEAALHGLARDRLWGWKGRSKMLGKGISRAEVLAQRDKVHADLQQLLASLDADLAAALHQDLQPLVRAYEAMKRRAGKLDFLDLLLLTRNLVAENRAVRTDLQQRFTHLLVDEFQDTDPLQAEILLLIASDNAEVTDFRRVRPVAGKLFVVGDPKQSIYRFRRADVMLYEQVKRQLSDVGGSVVHLTTSFRGAPSIQRAINAAFAPLMVGSPDGSQASYVELHPHRTDPTGRPTVVALPVPRPFSEKGTVTKKAVDESLPDTVAAFVDWLLRESGWKVTERERPGDSVPVAARHVCLLTRRFVNFGQDITRPYVRAFEARGVPHVLVGGRSFHAREEVIALRNALTAMEWPDDELSVFATLRGPFFALGDEALLVYRHRHRRLHPLAPMDGAGIDELTRPVVEALGVLRALHVGRNRRPLGDTITRLLEATRAHAGIAIWPTGEQALANLLRVVDQARRFEAGGVTSFRSFVQHLDDEADRGSAAEAPVVEEGTEGVRVMTVHKAKGLEFPVVVLIDPTCGTAHSQPPRYVDSAQRLWVRSLAGCQPAELDEHRDEVLRHERDEAIRVAYVAATRARDLLVIPAVGDEPLEGWLDVFNPVVYPRADARRRASPAHGCPAFGDDSAVERPPNREVEDGVQPGLHVPQAGDHQVVWWDPSALRLDVTEQVGLRQERILTADDGGAAAGSEHAYSEWERRRGERIEHGASPTVRVRTVTEARLLGEVVPERPVTVERIEIERDRPRGRRFGSLVHVILADVPLDAEEPLVSRLAQTKAHLLGATGEEAQAASRAVSKVLAHPVFERARACMPQVRRETPVVVARPDGSLVEGALDLAFRELRGGQAVWQVVDYKTDGDISGNLAEYERQLRIYMDAVAAATGEQVSGLLLGV